MIGKAHGAVGLRHVTKGEVERLQVLLPPIEEQERIAAILKEQMEAVERARAATQAQLDAAKALPAAYLREVFPQPGQPLPDGWRWSMLGDLCDRPGQYGTSKKSNGDRKGAPVLGMYHIYDGRIRWENMSHIELTSDELSRYLLSCGDLLFNRTNSAELVGKTAVYDLDAEAVFASYLIRFRLAKDTADPHFVCAYINSRNGRSFIERNMARAIGQVNISASTMHKMPIPIPDIAEQRRIAGVFREQMAAVKRLQAGLEAQLAEINVLPAALLRRAFNGGV
jgi:type I restriction enzyme S subunit